MPKSNDLNPSAPRNRRVVLSAHSHEPHISKYLAAIYHDVERILAPEIQSDQGRAILTMVLTLLGHLDIRAERGDTLLLGHSAGLLDALRELAEVAGRADLVAAAESQKSELTDGSARSTYQWVAGALEGLIAPAQDRAAHTAQAARTAIEKAIHAEMQWFEATESLENQRRRNSSALRSVMTSVTTDSLTQYLRSRAPATRRVEASRIIATLGGNSKDTIIVELAGADRIADRIVIRRDVPNGPFDVTAVDEWGVLEVLFDAGVPVAKPLWVERDPAVLGAPFIVTSFAKGVPAADLSTTVKSGDSSRHAMLLLAKLLAQVHALDVSRIADTRAIAHHPTHWHVSALIDLYDEQWHRRRLWYSPVIAAGFAWLRENMVSLPIRPAVIHGDASIRNLLVHEGDASALIDWETWHIGDPAEDIAYAEDEIAPYMPFADFISMYYECGGGRIDQDRFCFWAIWRHLRNAITAASMAEGTAYGTRPGVISSYSAVHWYRYTVQRLGERLLRPG